MGMGVSGMGDGCVRDAGGERTKWVGALQEISGKSAGLANKY